MDIINLILTRRSIRKYTDKVVSEELIQELLKAAMYAPSAGNQQVWHYLVINKKELLKSVSEFSEFATMLPSASAAILVCADTSLETKKGYWPIDCAAATQNILLAAHGLGMGSVWLGIYPRNDRQEKIRNLFALSENIQPFSLVSIGYPAEQKKTPERFKKERIHYNEW